MSLGVPTDHSLDGFAEAGDQLRVADATLHNSPGHAPALDLLDPMWADVLGRAE